MYTEFYNLTGQPFQLTPDHRFFFGSSVHKRAMAHLSFGLNQGEGFIVVTGDVGAGKTTLMGYLLSTLDSARYVSATLVTTQLAADDVLRMVASAFGIDQEQADKATLLRRIEAFCDANYRDGKHCLLLIDEVQNLSFQALEELRMLSNFQTDGTALVHSILLGQPQFRRTLASTDLDQLRQRVIASFHLGPISAQETRDYIRHRLSAVGWRDDPSLSEDAYAEIFKQTGGVPRKINVLCSRLLLFGFLEERHELDGAAVTQVAEDLRQETEQVLEIEETAPPEAVAMPVPLPQETVAPVDSKPVEAEAPPRTGRPELVQTEAPSETSDPGAWADAETELATLRHRLETAESQMQRHERMLRWTQLMLKHHERLLRRRMHKAASNG
ncbi:MAG: AAA family ATPase [Alphaproteobacteria bacterium]|nr:AAA family ATPase [Alphaproteobacteria bacterium]